MMSFPRRAASRLRLIVAIVLVMILTPLAPGPALAQSALYPGAAALVANTGGEPVLLRESPSFDAAVLSSFWEGTPADVLEGPVYDADGTAWYGVTIGGLTGYLVAGYLTEGAQSVEPAPVELAQEAVADETVSADAVPAPAAFTAEAPANPVATADLNLRAGPSYDDAVLLVIPAGSPLTPTGEWSEGFMGVTFQGQGGWVDSAWLGEGEAAPQEADLLQAAAPAAAPAPAAASAESAGVVGDLAAPTGATAHALDVVNLRLGPAESDPALRVLPPGAAVTITGESGDGWTPVWYNGTWGFIRADLLSVDPAASVSLAQEAAPAESLETMTGDGELLATAISDVNLRAGPDATAALLGTVPAGTELPTLAGPEEGFYQVQYGDQTGWVSGEYVEVSVGYQQRGNRESHQESKIDGSEPVQNAELGAGGIIWPVTGGLWYVMQGYNGSSHQNEDGLWQYYYSLDLARRDGNTAGQQVISPVNGVVRWTDPSSGGISIDIGNNHAVAMFHVTFLSGVQAGTSVRQGQYLGEISGPGGPGFAGTPHLHFTLWVSDDNGNWDRHAEPFTGPYAINGTEFPDIGGGSQYAGFEFSP
jgi:uncharacterized protein YraI